MHSLYYLGIILFSGMLMGKVVSLFKLPKVTGYLIAGVLIGPSIFNLVPSRAAGKLTVIADAALGFIAYSIGSQFNCENLKALGKRIFTITMFEALGAVIMVDLVMIFIFKMSIPFSITLGSIAAATAPAATLMVIKQYKAKGPVVNTLLPVVAMDDAVGIIIFGISTTVAGALMNNTAHFSMVKAIFFPFLEIIYALLLGLAVGVLLSIISKKPEGEDQLLSMTIASLFFTIGISTSLNISPLLSCMMVGATITNIAPANTRTLSVIDRFTPPVFIAFFTIAGVELNLTMLTKVGIVGIAYILTRLVGKIIGAAIGSKLSKCPKTVQKYLGLTLVPQAGVAIGLAMVAETMIPEFGSSIRTIILSATVIYELIGPLLTKTALIKAGEINLSNNFTPKTINKNL
ncbi:cation:proton antiporter [Clostridium ganghwense]|uniref:Cation:proton antiporter n=1 Tax=Clostridium ganghwense TaxID=312089 RepID=A0ABT4CPR5_9CLOT|nr:cation:proton antiporter [Clostridium ganghwense]MCY6370226.1 cation:proton antiporter [Clostridium ganghwense]